VKLAQPNSVRKNMDGYFRPYLLWATERGCFDGFNSQVSGL